MAEQEDEIAAIEAVVARTRDALTAALAEESKYLATTPGISDEPVPPGMRETYVRVLEAIKNHQAALNRLLEVRRQHGA